MIPYRKVYPVFANQFLEKKGGGGAVFTKVIAMFGFQCLVNERDSHNET